MATSISVIKGTSWLDLPFNVDSESSVEVDSSYGYQLTGFLGLLIEHARKKGQRHDIAVIAFSHPMQRMVYSAKHSAGYGQDRQINRMPISPKLFEVICGCCAENTPELLPAELDRISIVAAPGSFIPSFLKTFSE